MTNLVAFDTETARFGPCRLAPDLICATFAQRGGSRSLVAVADPSGPVAQFRGLLEADTHLVGHNTCFDLAVFCAADPNLFPLVWQALDKGLIHDTLIREKLLVLGTSGDLDYVRAGVTKKKREYSLAALGAQYLGKDRSFEKTAPDAWRINYAMLKDIPSAKWPKEALDYALDDAGDTLAIFDKQAHEASYLAWDVFRTEGFRVAVAFSLYLMSAWGLFIDPVARKKLEESTDAQLDASNFPDLIDAGILIPAKPGEPYKRQPGRFKAPTPEKISVGNLRVRVAAAWKARFPDKPLPMTDKGLVATDSEVITDLVEEIPGFDVDPVIQQYEARQSLQKVATTEIPRMQPPVWWPKDLPSIVHPRYDVMKATGRTSSYADKGSYPSGNVQNVDPRARECYVPRPGHVLCSADFSALELVSLARRCLTLIGWSVLAEKINAGVDPHAFLGAQIAAQIRYKAEGKDGKPEVEAQQAAFWAELTGADGLVSARRDHDRVYKAFMARKKAKGTPERKFFDHFRTFAKPTGLGYPGGLGAKTFVAYAKATYGVIVDLPTAYALKELWLEVYPEMKFQRHHPRWSGTEPGRQWGYFDWVSNQTSTQHPGQDEDRPYFYTSPLGVVRKGATYCATANGNALQTPGAEAACTAVWRVQRASYDPTVGSCLYGTHPVAFVHDEIISEFPEDDYMTARALELSRLMQESLSYFMAPIKVAANPCLMRRWNKDAEPVWENGKLMVWEPKKGS